MRIALVGAELEENLGLRYMASSLEAKGHETEIIPFNSEADTPIAVQRLLSSDCQIAGLSMVFTSRAREFCDLAESLRRAGFGGQIIAGGHFASFNSERLLRDVPALDLVALGEGEELMCSIAERAGSITEIPGLCYRKTDGSIATNASTGNPGDLDSLPFPKRFTFHRYFDKPIASILSSRGCWRDCAFCSINAWYKRGGGKRFRIRSVENIVDEMSELYFEHGVRIFNFQDDNFFLPNREKAAERFIDIRDSLQSRGVENIAIAVKARPDSITEEAIRVLDDLGLFRVFLGVENASEQGLRNLNRKCDFEQILEALRILNDFDVHLAFNILIFEPDTVLDDILVNLRFIERHMENPFNFCRAEAYAGTGLEAKLLAQGRLLGDYFGFDYRLKDPRSEAFHQIANYAFFDRNFSDQGLHYFNMQVDFYFQLLRRFYPEALTETLRGAVRNFIKRTNLDTYEHLCWIYDFVGSVDPSDQLSNRAFARDIRESVDEASSALHAEGERLIWWLTDAHETRGRRAQTAASGSVEDVLPLLACTPLPYGGQADLTGLEGVVAQWERSGVERVFGIAPVPIPYSVARRRFGVLREPPG